MEQFGAVPSGQRLWRQLSTPDARHNYQLINSSPLYGYIQGMLTIPFLHLWSTDAATDPPLAALLEPVWNAVIAFTPHQELLPQWERLAAAVRSARRALDTEPMGKPTVNEIIADILSSLRTTLLISCTGQQGSTRLITEELLRQIRSFGQPITLPMRRFDLATNKMVDHPSRTTLNLEGFKYFANRDSPASDGTGSVEELPESQPAVVKQFAAQAIVDFYTDWEEYYRRELAAAHECSHYDFQIDYFGDLNRMRQDYVHNRGVCSASAYCKILKWFSQGELMIPTPQNYVELLSVFPGDELRQKPSPRTTGTDRVTIRASTPVIREFEKLAGQVRESKGDALNEALSEWIARNSHGTNDF